MLVHPGFDPVAFSLGPLSIHWYGLMYVAGFLCGWFLGRWRAARKNSGWTPREVDDLIAFCVVGVVLGGRLGYALFYAPGFYLSDPAAFLRIWEGGMSFHGGLLGVALAVWVFCRVKGKTFLQVGDFLAPMVPPGLFFGRIGNFINGELWGRTTDASWGVVFRDPLAGAVPRHPSQLYEAVLEGLVLFVVMWIFSRKKRTQGRVAGLFLLLYACFRFAVEFVRRPDGLVVMGWLTMGQILCLPMVAFGLWLLLRPVQGW